MSEARTCSIVQFGKPPTHFLITHHSGYGVGWMRGMVGRHNAYRYADKKAANSAARNTKKPLRAGEGTIRVAEVTERKAFVIRAVGISHTFWLQRQRGGDYRWRWGSSALVMAGRFDEREDAEAVRRHYSGVGGVASEVVEISFLDD